jgi:hypothetical protein
VAHTTLSVFSNPNFPQNFAAIIDRKLQPVFEVVDRIYPQPNQESESEAATV